MVRTVPGSRVKGTNSVAPGDGSPLVTGARAKAAPRATSCHAMVSGSHQPPRNHAWFTSAPGSSTVAWNSAFRHGWSAGPADQRVNPPVAARTPWASRPSIGRKFRALKEKTACSGAREVLRNRYSSAATGSDASSALPGTNGLQPVISAVSGIPGSLSETVPNGKRARNAASAKRGRPKVDPPSPCAEPRAPNTFHPGTGPSMTRAAGVAPAT